MAAQLIGQLERQPPRVVLPQRQIRVVGVMGQWGSTCHGCHHSPHPVEALSQRMHFLPLSHLLMCRVPLPPVGAMAAHPVPVVRLLQLQHRWRRPPVVPCAAYARSV
jgi:hypothetical protein